MHGITIDRAAWPDEATHGPADGAAAGAPTRASLPAWGHTIALPLAEAGAWHVATDDEPDRAWVVVTGGAAAVTAPDGSATLGQVPPGTHTVTAWLPPSGAWPAVIARADATVVAGETVQLTVRMGS